VKRKWSLKIAWSFFEKEKYIFSGQAVFLGGPKEAEKCDGGSSVDNSHGENSCDIIPPWF